uniref:RING-type E3 ubiquitin transferase n=1 Tax=Leersia perrieri TaxID=77586 RepID=A0A0D9WM64_9ORYZ
MGAPEKQKEAAEKEKKAGDKAYDIEDYEAAAKHYGRGALIDGSDLSFFIKLAKAKFGMKMYKECAFYCDELITKAMEMSGNNKEELIKEAQLWKASALANLATCAKDCEPAITLLEQYCFSKNTNIKLEQTMNIREMFVEQELIDEEAAKPYQDEGRKLFKEGMYEEAEIMFTEATEKNPRDPKNFWGRAQCRFDQEKFSEVVEDADRCIELNPSFGKGYVYKALAQLRMEKYEDALLTIADGLDHDPGNPEIPGVIRGIAANFQIAKSNSDARADNSRKVEQLISQNHLLNKELQSALNLKCQLEEYNARYEELRPYFSCAISQDVMEYPVIAADGHTYEAEMIKEWFKRGNTKSPMTNLPLKHKKLIPNYKLRSAIQKWRQLQNKAPAYFSPLRF